MAECVGVCLHRRAAGCMEFICMITGKLQHFSPVFVAEMNVFAL